MLGQLGASATKTVFRGECLTADTHGSPVWSLTVLADGRLASGGDDGNIKIWLVDEQKLIAALCLRAGRNLTKDQWARYISPDTLGSRAVATSPRTGGPRIKIAAPCNGRGRRLVNGMDAIVAI